MNEKLNEAVKCLVTLIGFFTTLGYDPKADKKIGIWVNEINRDKDFTVEVETVIGFLEALHLDLLHSSEIEARLLAEHFNALKQQLDSLRGEKAATNRAKTKKTKNGATHPRCGVCSSRRCDWDGKAIGGNHPARPAKARK
jgi:hypothetical protein